jgi:putative PEP-CTERM system histidine kinase
MLNGVATYSYSVAALVFLLLTGLLLTKWRTRVREATLAGACLLTVLWSSAVAYEATLGIFSSILTNVLEIFRSAGWSAFLLILLGHFQRERNGLPFRLKPYLLLIAGFYLLVLIASVLGDEILAPLGFMPLIAARVGLAVLGMLLVEQLYRNKPAQERWAIKFACLGIGGMFAYDFYMYADAMLFRKVNPEIWAARGVVDALTAPLIAISASRSTSWSSEISVSRRVLFHSATLFGAASYLLIMASAGYYLRFFGGNWGSVMQVAFLFGALILLIGILFSGAFRSWLKVFLSKHFYSYNYDYREEWLRFTRTLSDEGPRLGDRAIQAVAELVESPGGALWIKRESGSCEPVAHWHIPLATAVEPESSSFCQFLEHKQWVIDLREFETSPEKYGDLSIPEWLRKFPRAWLIVPLILQGRLVGFVLLITPRSAINLNWEVIDLLKIAGSQAASYLAQQESANALMISRQFESFNRMSTFMVHDLKNLVSQLSLLVSNAEKHKNNPEFQRDMLETVTHSVQRMKLLLQKLSRNATPERTAPLCIDEVLQQAVVLKSAFEPTPVLKIEDAGLMVLADRGRLERVVGHIIQNAIEATAKDGCVTIRLTRHGDDDTVIVEISDTGKGMNEEFIRERLFKPFETTKSAGMGIGAFESREYIRELGGRLEVMSQPPVGTTFKIILPLYKLETQAVERAA